MFENRRADVAVIALLLTLLEDISQGMILVKYVMFDNK